MPKKAEVSCANCDLEKTGRICVAADGKPSKGCPTVSHPELLEKANRELAKPSIAEFARQASVQEAACYANRDQKPYVMQPVKTRIQEICEFARRLGYRRLGLAFCLGLVEEAREVIEESGEHSIVRGIYSQVGAPPPVEGIVALGGDATGAHLTNVAIYLVPIDERRITAEEFVARWHGKVRDNASPQLAQIRASLHDKQGAVTKKVNQVLNRARKEGWIEEDAGATYRNGRPVIPAKSAA